MVHVPRFTQTYGIEWSGRPIDDVRADVKAARCNVQRVFEDGICLAV